MPAHILSLSGPLDSAYKLAPKNAADVTVTANAVAWTMGVKSATILTTTTETIVVGAYLDPGNDSYDVDLVDDATDEIICTWHARGNAAATPTQPQLAGSKLLASGVTLKATASSAGGGASIGIKILYKEL